VLDAALTAAQTSGDRCHEAELHRLKGELALREGSPARISRAALYPGPRHREGAGQQSLGA
jgi:hypothetical protein